MPTFRCRKCNFKYVPKTEMKKPPRLCPYCSSQGTLLSDENIVKEL